MINPTADDVVEISELDLLANRIQETVSEFGKMTDDQIAVFMNDIGIKGKACGATNCPVSNYIRWRYPEIVHVSTGPSMILLADNKDVIHDRARRRLLMVPASLRSFICYFDGGKWPELVEQ